MTFTSSIVSTFKRGTRGKGLSLALGVVSLAAVSTASLAAVLPLKSNFIAYDATRYGENPDLTKYGLTDVTVVYESSMWPAGASKSEPNTSYIANTYIPKIRSKNPKLLIIDIETWKFTSSMTATQITATINKFKKVVDVFRRGLPNTKLGFYLVMPERNWLAPCGDPGKYASRMASWHERNLKLKPLAAVVDVIVPSLYTFYGDATSQACWPKYAAANIKEARTFGKPVIPFLWMKYQSTGLQIPSYFFRKQLDTVYPLADGLAIWSMASSNERWSYSAPWWLETAKFLQAQKLVP
jgi:hypothetical protein